MRLTKENSYTVTLKINGESVTRKSTDLDKAIMRCKPEFSLTEAYVIAKGKVVDGAPAPVSERKLSLNQVKDIFLRPEIREIFINNLLLN